MLTGCSQRLGDLAAGTTVVYRHRATEPGATRSSSRAARKVLLAVLVVAALFTAAFDYFGRPALVIEGLNNEHQLLAGQEVTSYSLGSPQWAVGSVTYPMTLTTTVATCNGSIQLVWSLVGWTEGAADFTCSA